jgi:parvulin-like peptidyl-prolyl isomerase
MHPTVILAVSMALILGACAGQPAPTQTPAMGGTVQPGATRAGKATNEPIVALVNGKPIFKSVFERTVTRRLEGIRALNDPMPADLPAYRLQVLDTLIEDILIEQAADIQGVKVTDADVEKEFQENITIAGGKDKLTAQIEANRMTESEYRTGLRSALIAGKMRDIVTRNACVAVEQIHARHILVPDEKSAVDVKSKLNTGTDFAQLAVQFSLDVTTRQTGGDLGWFARGQLLQKSVEDAAFSLGINEVSAPVKSELGYHIIQTLERVKDRQIDADTCYRLSEATFDRWIQELMRQARIEKYPDGQS